MKVLSLFDGMACGMLAMMKADISVDDYFAYEIDKYAIQTATHNFPQIQECGDVFNADFAKYSNIDYLIGGSPCTYWSCAQSSDKRETTASGIGWELFSQYVRALHEAKPKFFIYENNKSMSKAIRESITETFGFEDICINSARVSAQNRQRLYWVGKRNADGTYSKVDVEQPEDRGILLRDVLDGIAFKDKQNCIDANYYKGGNYSNPKKQSNQRMCVAEPVGVTKSEKSYCLTQGYSNGSGENIGNYVTHTLEKGCKSMVAEPVNTTADGKSQTIKAQDSNTDVNNICKYSSNYGASGVTEPVAINTFNNEGRKSRTVMSGYYKYGEATILTNKGFKGGTTAVAEPVNVTADGKAQCLRATCYKDGIRNIAGNIIDKKTGVAEPVCVASRGRYSDTGNRTNKTDAPTYQHYEARTDGKTNAITTVSKDNLIGEPVCMRYERSDKAKQLRKDYESGAIKHGYHEYCELQPRADGKTNTLSTVLKDNPICEPVRVGLYPTSDGRLLNSQGMRIYSTEAKSVTQSAQGGGMGAKTGLYAIPVEFNGEIPVKAISAADSKTYTVYEVKGGNITIKSKTYPIKLIDGYYIIRKLTVSECKRLQTVPDWYEFPVSDTQAYKMLGNGWTVDVIVHILKFLAESEDKE